MEKSIRGFLLLCICSMVVNLTNAQNPNKADSIIQAFLDLINRAVKDPNSDPHMKRSAIITFFEALTGIGSEADLSFAGKSAVSQRDFDLWYAWYFVNKEHLSWDDQKKIIVLHKTVKPPGYK